MKMYLLGLMVAVCIGGASSHWANQWDKPFRFSCPKGGVIRSLFSIHNNHREDRRWIINCGLNLRLSRGKWTRFVNRYDKSFRFRCPARNGIITGFGGVHNNHKEDRRFRFKCARFINKVPYNCRWTGFLNKFDKVLNFHVRRNRFIRGMRSVHNNHFEDRRFSLLVCSYRHFKG
ncbi:millepora cytotoxin-1-like [Hydractinia symbiolongicarpus]|uniref:millepora cytotoxin-1-like n=1 Tax=Hydractinia symbiolongicarpus TaxID=13093 RepID=UPI00254B8C0A|nr:millepora cytotoxin-1-like [Hydractinia symbiolongicarpus]